MKRPQYIGKGQLHGVNFVHRGENDLHPLVQIFTEDDCTWSQSMSFSAHWLPDLIRVLQVAQKDLDRKGIKGKEGEVTLCHKDVVANVQQIYTGE